MQATSPVADVGNKRLILFDVDGTLVDDSGAIFSAAPHVIESLADRMTVGLCSARPLSSMKLLGNSLPGVTYIAASQGALVAQRLSTNDVAAKWVVVGSWPFNDSEIAKIVAGIGALGCECFYHGSDSWFVVRESEASRKEAEICGVPPVVLESTAALSSVYKVVALLPHNGQESTHIVRAIASLGVQASLSKPNYVEVTSSTASPSKGASPIQAFLGFAPSDTITVGDAENDLGMFQCASIAFTFEKAPEEVRRTATYVLPNPEKGGLAHLLSFWQPRPNS